MIKDNVIKSILKEIAKENNLSFKEVEAIYESQWDFMRDTIEDLDLNEVDEEEFKDLKTNFNIPALGKLYTTYNKIDHVRKKSREITEGRNTTGDDV